MFPNLECVARAIRCITDAGMTVDEFINRLRQRALPAWYRRYVNFQQRSER